MNLLTSWFCGFCGNCVESIAFVLSSFDFGNAAKPTNAYTHTHAMFSPLFWALCGESPHWNWKSYSIPYRTSCQLWWCCQFLVDKNAKRFKCFRKLWLETISSIHGMSLWQRNDFFGKYVRETLVNLWTTYVAICFAKKLLCVLIVVWFCSVALRQAIAQLAIYCVEIDFRCCW